MRRPFADGLFLLLNMVILNIK